MLKSEIRSVKLSPIETLFFPIVTRVSAPLPPTTPLLSPTVTTKSFPLTLRVASRLLTTFRQSIPVLILSVLAFAPACPVSVFLNLSREIPKESPKARFPTPARNTLSSLAPATATLYRPIEAMRSLLFPQLVVILYKPPLSIKELPSPTLVRRFPLPRVAKTSLPLPTLVRTLYKPPANIVVSPAATLVRTFKPPRAYILSLPLPVLTKTLPPATPSISLSPPELYTTLAPP